MRILIMGLPGSGKTELAKQLKSSLIRRNYSVVWFNADSVRKQYNDWDFSAAGRLRQTERMRNLSSNQSSDYVICDFVAPTQSLRDTLSADFIIWIDTISKCKYEDTNSMFEKPTKYDVHVTTYDTKYWTSVILDELKTKLL